ncbi:hypothetical protein LTR91_023293 [Friedmanniomyces endolithicus]|uniref:C3H1-type domain-containing protein n=1 Tax=Friedmanniomyces endolithicus TaxID=329885 RepID=A0AAN6K1N3_9PEZI|nr:hypothetical protein LTR35_016181 [Friedmanniomyces endolithicus]KAK0297801.1 hypothetical protein LTS00_003339 [Friedmanniomyces endolithicus]KAK0306217.1 hypothetical protein LTR82_016515 [Friedmanniomyces endolithicus]KAK0892336.1 hypothetical protein LTR57_024444 [Friedmanniomyces endolithicus]KAK0954470.1 hypothetical protein LTR91_023293 [Friedmanniomyces endolithicus]
MNGGFSFPPPPPPPPKAAPSRDSLDTYGFSGRDRGRGRGRGSGGGPAGDGGRGRGRGDYHVKQDRNRGYGRDAAPWTPPAMDATPSNGNMYAQNGHNRPAFQNLPTGTHVNPNFVPLNSGPPSRHRPTDEPSLPASTSPPRTVAGHKRKLDALRPPQHEYRPGPQPAPEVPKFGASFLPPKPGSTTAAPSQPKRGLHSNGLGLTPSDGPPIYSSSDDEPDNDNPDLDEEALHAELGEKLTFEHNGVVLSLSSAADLAIWQNERRKNWPTRARMSEKEAERRQVGEERKRLFASAARVSQRAVVRTRREEREVEKMKREARAREKPELAGGKPGQRSVKTATEVEKARRELKAQEAKLAALRKRVAKGQAAVDLARASQVEADDAEVERLAASLSQPNETQPPAQEEADNSDAASSVLSVSSVLSSDTSSDPDANSADDDDELPEEAPSKPSPPDSSTRPQSLCKYFAASGYCRDGEACRYRHELVSGGPGARQSRPVEQTPKSVPQRAKVESERGRKGIYRRLVEQQGEEEDRVALQVIKYLGKAGFFGGGSAGDSVGESS